MRASLLRNQNLHIQPVGNPLKSKLRRIKQPIYGFVTRFKYNDLQRSINWLLKYGVHYLTWNDCQSTWRYAINSASGPWFNIKMPSYQYRKSHCGDKPVVRSSYLHNGISYTDKMASFHWISPQDIFNTVNQAFWFHYNGGYVSQDACSWSYFTRGLPQYKYDVLPL